MLINIYNLLCYFYRMKKENMTNGCSEEIKNPYVLLERCSTEGINRLVILFLLIFLYLSTYNIFKHYLNLNNFINFDSSYILGSIIKKKILNLIWM